MGAVCNREGAEATTSWAPVQGRLYWDGCCLIFEEQFNRTYANLAGFEEGLKLGDVPTI